MKRRIFTIEDALFILAIVLGLIIRLWGLGSKHLSDSEAYWALQALSVAKGEQIPLGSQPGYIFVTGFLFWLLGSSNFVARLWPAIAGSLMIGAPYLLRNILGRYASMVVAFGIALDPILITYSRTIGSVLPAISFVIFALCLIKRHSWSAAGIFIGFALLSGASVVQGILIAGIAWVFYYLTNRFKARQAETVESGEIQTIITNNEVRKIGISVLLIIFLVGTLFFRYPQGLSSLFLQIPDYLKLWVNTQNIPFMRLLLAIIVYQPIGVLFGIFGIIRFLFSKSQDGLSYRLKQYTLICLAIIFVIVMLKPGRSIDEAIWIIIPLWLFAGSELAEYFNYTDVQQRISTLLSLIIVILCIIFWMQLSAISQNISVINPDYLRLATIAALFSLAALTLWLVATGWSLNTARTGLIGGIVFSLALYTLANIGGIVKLAPNQGETERQELCYTYPLIGEADLLLSTLHDLSEWKAGQPEEIDVIVKIDSPSIRWLLRGFDHVKYLPEYASVIQSNNNTTENPSLILDLQGEASPDVAFYRGQDFNWWWTPAWSGILPSNFLKWLIFRQSGWSSGQVILWARSDLFPGGATNPIVQEDLPEIEPGSISGGDKP